jgi:hypothetical protein
MHEHPAKVHRYGFGKTVTDLVLVVLLLFRKLG